MFLTLVTKILLVLDTQHSLAKNQRFFAKIVPLFKTIV